MEPRRPGLQTMHGRDLAKTGDDGELRLIDGHERKPGENAQNDEANDCRQERTSSSHFGRSTVAFGSFVRVSAWSSFAACSSGILVMIKR